MDGQELIDQVSDGEAYENESGHLVTVSYDPDCESPRTYEGNLGTFYTYVRGHASPDGDEGVAPDFDRLVWELCLDDDWERENGESAWTPSGWQWLFEKLEGRGYVALPVAGYDHGQLTYAIGEPGQFPDAQWDAGFAGIIYASPERMHEAWGVEDLEVVADWRGRAAAELTQEVEEYDLWARGECYRFVEYDTQGEVVEALGGFIGPDPAKSGMGDYTGRLVRSECRDVDEWVERGQATMAGGCLADTWRTQIADTATEPYERVAEVYLSMARKARELDGEQYSLEDELAFVEEGNVYAIDLDSQLYEALVGWYGSTEALMECVRFATVADGRLHFFTGGNYATYSADLLGGSADGRAERDFEHYLETGQRPHRAGAHRR